MKALKYSIYYNPRTVTIASFIHMFCTVRLKVLLTKHDLSEGRGDYFYFLFFIFYFYFFIFIFLSFLLFNGEFFGVFSIIYIYICNCQ